VGPIQSIPEFLSWLRRRAPLILVVAMLGALAGIAAALQSERVYSATAVIQVINPVISDEGGAAAATTLTRRVQTIEQQLMSRENVLALADRYGMFQDRDISLNEQVALLREAISIENIAAAHTGYTSDGALSGLVISTRASDPVLAAAISNELAGMLVSQSASTRQESAQSALRFFQQEEARLQELIEALSDQIAAFQTVNEGFLPGAQVLRREDLRRLEDSRLEIERGIVQLRSELATLDANSRRTITLRRIAQINDEITARTDEAALINARIDAIRGDLVRAPEVAREINAMERTMTQLQAQLTSAAERRRDAEVGLRIEDDQQSDRFVLLEAALVPEHAVSTGRKKIAAVWAMAGVMLGLGLAYVLEWMHPAMRTAQQMERELQLRPVISIPYALSGAEIRRRRFLWGLGSGLIVVVAALAALVALQVI